MGRLPMIEELEAEYMKKETTSFKVGDTVCVNTRIIEGEKERLQAFTGTVVAKKGRGLSETFTLYRTAYGSSMDRVFLLHSPRIASIEVIRSGKVRRAKLYYLRGRSGKKAKVEEQYSSAPAAEAKAMPAAPQAYTQRD
ncbi:MAG: ribosomal protein [Chlamydiota bacterium]